MATSNLTVSYKERSARGSNWRIDGTSGAHKLMCPLGRHSPPTRALLNLSFSVVILSIVCR